MRRVRGLMGDWACGRHGCLILLLLLPVSWYMVGYMVVCLSLSAFVLTIRTCLPLSCVCSLARQAIKNAS